MPKLPSCKSKNADEEIFVRLAAITRTGLHLAADGSFILDGLITDVLKDTRVTTPCPIAAYKPSA